MLSFAALGATIGALTVILSMTVDGATTLFSICPALVWFLPVAGFASYGLYRVLRLDFSWSTARVMEAVRTNDAVPFSLVIAVIAGTALTVLCGGSVGKEAAALQMGVAASAVFRGRVISRYRSLLARASMASALGAMLGAPLAGVVFCFESLRENPESARHVVLPLVSSVVAWAIALAADVTFIESPAFPALDDFVGVSVIPILAIGIGAAFLSMLFCDALAILRRGLAWLGAPVFALAVGGVVTALILGYANLFHYEELYAYCGTGVNQIDSALNGGGLPWWSFLIKAALTLLTLSGGFKGGEIMPVLAIGACLGEATFLLADYVCDGGFASLNLVLVEVGMVSFFAACSNCPLTALVMCFELFGIKSVLFSVLPAVIAYLLSRSSSLYPTTIKSTS